MGKEFLEVVVSCGDLVLPTLLECTLRAGLHNRVDLQTVPLRCSCVTLWLLRHDSLLMRFSFVFELSHVSFLACSIVKCILVGDPQR